MISLASVSASGVARKGEVTASLRGVTVELRAGITVLVGARPSGGPLLLDLVCGRVRPKSGSVTVLGAPAGSSALAKDVAYVPIGAELPPGLTVLECLRLSLAARASGPRNADAALERLGVTALAQRRTETLSPGEHRAALLSMALAASPRVVLMEEPCNWFDPRALSKITEALRSLASEGSAVVLATQSAHDAARIGGRHLRLIAGALEEGLAEPPFVALRLACERPHELAAAIAALAPDATITMSPRELVVSGKDLRALVVLANQAIAAGAFDVTELERVGRGELAPRAGTEARA